MCFALLISTIRATALRINYSISGALGGPMLGVFTLGLFFPWTTTKVCLFVLFVLEKKTDTKRTMNSSKTTKLFPCYDMHSKC